MKDIILNDKLIVGSSITSIDISLCDFGKAFKIVVRQGNNSTDIFYNNDKDIVQKVYNKIIQCCDGVVFKDIVNDVLCPQINQEEKPSPQIKRTRRKKSDNNVGKE